MKTITLTGLVVAAIYASEAHSETIFGYGNTTCGAYTEDLRPKGNALSTAAAVSWVQGYVTRASLGYKFDLTADLDPPALRGWLANYCADHPLDILETAAGALEDELHLRNGPKEEPPVHAPKPRKGK